MASDAPTLDHPRVSRFFPVTYGLIHAMIDASCVTAVFHSIFLFDVQSSDRLVLVLTYNILAFAGQSVLGLAIDKYRFTRGAILLGVVSTALAVILMRFHPLTTAILAGLGNALFHVGAGALSLHVRTGRATPPGIFVAPGALGLGLSAWIRKSDLVFVWPFMVVLSLVFFYALASANPRVPYDDPPKKPKINRPMLILMLLLFSITIRSFVGMGAAFACPKTTLVPFALASAAFAGKAMGGVLSDRLGWLEISVGALLVSVPLITFGGTNAVTLTLGLFLFQMTMPVTLVACAMILPGRPAFAFGLTCLALILGALPSFFATVRAHYDHNLFLVLILLSATVVYIALRELRKDVPMKFAGD